MRIVASFVRALTNPFEDARRSSHPLSSKSLLGVWQLHRLESGYWPGHEGKFEWLMQCSQILRPNMLMTVRMSQTFALRVVDQ